MINIIKSDLYRILRGKAIYICIYIIMMIAVASTITLTPGSVGINLGSNEMDSEYIEKISKAKSLDDYREIIMESGTFELDVQMVGNNATLYYIFVVIVVILISTDFSNNTIKNSLSSAISRKKYYFAKLFLSLGICTFLILFNNYFSYFLNLIVNGSKFSSSIFEITKITLYQLPLLYGMISLLVGLSFLCKKTALFNSISIPFIMIFQLVCMMIINIFRLKGDLFYNYEFQYAIAKLVTSPATSYIIKCACLGLAYVIIFNIIGYISFTKSEIK